MKRAGIAVGVLLFVAAGVFAAEYLAAWLYFLIVKKMPTGVVPGTFLSLWDQLSTLPAARNKLLGAGTVAAAIVFLAPLFVYGSRRGSDRSLHGDARFAKQSEIKAAGLFADNGIIVGKVGNQFLMFAGQQFVLLAAPTRSGKGVGVVIPNLLNWPDSAVVLDIKGENFAITSGYRAKHGQKVFLFAPYAKDFRSHRWNPLSAISRDPNFAIGDIQAIAEIFYPTDYNVKDTFWNDQAQNLFIGLALYLMETPELLFTVGEIYRQGSGCGQPLGKHIANILVLRSVPMVWGDDLRQPTKKLPDPNVADTTKPLSAACRDALSRFLSNSDNTFASIKSTFEAPLLMFSNPIVDAATSGDDFDVRQLRRERMTIYVAIEPNKLASASRLLNLFFSQLLNLNMDKLPEHDPSLKYPCLVMPDEFTAMGRIGVIGKSVAFMAGYGMRLLPVVQSIEQIEDVYGKEASRNFVKNHDLKIIFPPDDQEDAERVSKTLGYLTQEATSEGRSHSYGGGRGSNSSQSQNVSDQRRALLLAQEIREMPKEDAIIIKSHTKPILCKKIRYFEENVFKNRLLPPITVKSMNMNLHRAIVEKRTKEVTYEQVKGIDMSTLAINYNAIAKFTGDRDNPTPENVKEVVDSFMTVMQRKGTGGETGVQQRSVAKPAERGHTPNMAGNINLALLDS